MIEIATYSGWNSMIFWVKMAHAQNGKRKTKIPIPVVNATISSMFQRLDFLKLDLNLTNYLSFSLPYTYYKCLLSLQGVLPL